MSTSNNNSTIVYSVDASGFEAGVNKIKAGAATVNASQDAMAKRAAMVDAAMKEAAANGFDLNARAANKLAAEYQRLADTAGKTQAQILAQRAAATGVTSSFAGMASQIEEASKQTHGLSFATSAAKRELLVLAHELSQGNYKKFGGSLLVEAERTGAAGLLFSAAGLSALALTAAIAGLAYEVIKGAMAFDALAKSSSATNGYLGLTDSQLGDMAKNLAGTSQSITSVEATMTGLVESGRIAADQLSLATKVTTEFAHDTGMAAEDAVKAMVKFAEDPKKALEELQNQYHTFSGAQVEVIEGYIKTGDKASAYKAILEGMDEAHARMAKTGVEQVGVLQKAWDLFKADVIDTINHINHIGVATSDAEKYTAAVTAQAEAQANLNKAMAFPTGFGGQNIKVAQAALDIANAQLKAQQQTQTAAQQTADANKTRATSGDAALRATGFISAHKFDTPAQQHQQSLDENAAAFNAATKDLDKSGSLYAEALKKNQDNITFINEQYAKKTKAHAGTSGIGAQLADLMGQNKLIEQEEKRSEQTLKAQRAAGLVDSSQYLQQLHDLQAAALVKEIALAQQRADVAGGKKDKATQQSALAQVKEYNAQLLALDQTLTQDLAKVAAVRDGNLRKFAAAEDSTLQKQKAGYALAYNTRNLTGNDLADFNARYRLQESQEIKIAALKEQYEGPTADKKELDGKLALAEQGYKSEQAALEASLAQQQYVRNSYSEQITHAMATIAGTSKTNAELAATAFTTSFNDMGSALDTFVTTGKISFSGLASSILSDLAKIALQAAESQVFKSLATSTSFFSEGGAVGHFADGGSISGPGTGTSDSIPAMLSDGEYVINAASTKKYGSLLAAINSGRMSHFASGGAVGSVAPSSGGGTTNLSLSLGAGNSGLTQEDLAAIAPHIQNLVDKRMAKRMGSQGGFADMIRQNRI